MTKKARKKNTPVQQNMPGPGCGVRACAATRRRAAMVAEVRGVFGTLTYPHLILPYSAYYCHLESHYGGSWCSPTAWWCDEKHLQARKPFIYVKMVGLPVLSVLNIGSPHTKPPPYVFLNLYGACLQAPRTPKMK